MPLGQLGDLEARPPPCVWPLRDDDGQPVLAGQPGHVLNQEQGFAMSEMEIVEQEHRDLAAASQLDALDAQLAITKSNPHTRHGASRTARCSNRAVRLAVAVVASVVGCQPRRRPPESPPISNLQANMP